MPEFDKNTYDFLKKRLKAGKKNEKNYDNLITLLESYILNGKVELCKAGLIGEIKNLREEKRINTNKDYVYDPTNKRIDLNELDLCFIEGNLAKVRDELIKLKDYYFTELPSFLSFFCCGYNIYYGGHYLDYRDFFNMDYYSDYFAS